MSLIKLWHKKNGSHQTKKYLLPLFTALCTAALVFTGCANSAGSSSKSSAEKISVTVKTEADISSASSILPSLSGTFRLSFKEKGALDSTYKLADGEYPDYQMIIIPGEYTFRLESVISEEDSTVILTGETDFTVESGMENVTICFMLSSPEGATGNGSVSLFLSADTDTKIETFSVSAVGTEGESSFSWSKDEEEASYLKGTLSCTSLAPGTYTLVITGLNSLNEPVYVRHEVLTVWSNVVSGRWIFADGSSSNELKITASDLYSTFYVKGSTGPYNFYKEGVFGDANASDDNSGSIDCPLQTVSVAVNKCVVSNKPYTIYVDGTVNEVNYSSSDPTAINIFEKIITIKSIKPEGGKSVIQADGNGRIMYAGGTVVLEDLVLKGGGNTDLGGGIYVGHAKVLTMKNCTITDCNATTFGGGLYIATNGSANLNGCTISKNTAQNGGGIYQSGNVTLTDCTFSGNTATINGKALYLQSGTLNVNGKIQSSTDDFYIITGKTITIQSPLSTDSSILVTPSSYTVGTQILQADSGANLADEVYKFKVSEDKWLISSDGKLFSLGTTSTSAEDNIAIFTNIPAGCEATVNLDNLSQTSWSGSSPASISGNVTVTATNGKTISSGSDSIFTVKNGGTLTLNENVTLETSSQGTSCINVEEGGTLILNGATIQATSGFNVSGITITHGTLTINTGNITNFTGSPIVATNSIITITGGTISSNFSNVKLTDCTANIKNLIVTGNTTSGNGGGINISGGGTYMFNDCQITNNTASVRGGTPRYGGGIYIDTTGTVSFTNCNISGNTAKGYTTSNLGKGGGIYLNSGRLTTTGCTISSNTTTNGTAEVTGSGSQIYAVAGSVYNEETLKEDMIIDTYSE